MENYPIQEGPPPIEEGAMAPQVEETGPQITPFFQKIQAREFLPESFGFLEYSDYDSRISLTNPKNHDLSNVQEAQSEKLKQAFQEASSVLHPILEYLSAEDLCSLACVSKAWNQEASHNYYWKKLFLRDLGLDVPENHNYVPGSVKKLYEQCTPKVGDLLEVVDTVHKWVVCRIIAVLNRRLFLVYFEGWAEDYIMWVDKERDSQRIRPIHPQYLTGIGLGGPLTKRHYESMLFNIQTIFSQEPPITFPLPPCNYFPSVYYLNEGNHFDPRPLLIKVGDPQRLLRLQASREGGFVETRVQQKEREVPLWLCGYPMKSGEPFYGASSNFSHGYFRDLYPDEIHYETDQEVIARFLNISQE